MSHDGSPTPNQNLSIISLEVFWAHISLLRIEHCNEDILLATAKTIRKPIQVHVTTFEGLYGKFAGFYVEVNLTEPSTFKNQRDETLLKVEYEGL